MSVLNDIAIRYSSDKSSETHNFCDKYEKYLPFERYDKLKILEIGVLEGKSMKMWKDYFYRSDIVGIDILPQCKEYEEERISIEIGSQNDKDFLSTVAQKHGPFDLIIDDGSHLSEDVIYSFQHLFESLKSGGVYVVEDICTSYWSEFRGGYKKTGTSIEFFKDIADDANFRGIEYMENGDRIWFRRESLLVPYVQSTHPECRTDIESVNFLNALTIITKR